MTHQSPDFLIVGTGRSGTTLVQRLVCEIPGVKVPPETHFFVLFAPGLLKRRRFPLSDSDLEEELELFAALKTSRGMELNSSLIVDDLGGSCHTLAELFGAIVRQLAGGAELYGEKTPRHLLWWRPLTRAMPDLKIVAVVRDPRAVVASNLPMPWGMSSPAVLAELWRSDQRQVVMAERQLGGDHCLVVRYEDAVSDPAAQRVRLAAFLGLNDGQHPTIDGPRTIATPIHLPWESWKEKALGPITTDRISAWQEQLTPAQSAEIVAICRREMMLFGYGEEPGRFTDATTLLRLTPATQWRRLHFRLGRRRRLGWINKVSA